MSVTLTSSDCAEARAMAQLRRMVALSATFQAKAGDYAECLERVMYEGVPTDAIALADGGRDAPSSDKPFASIWLVSTGWSMAGGGSRNHMLAKGTLHLYLMTPREQTHGWNDARLEAIQFLGNWERDVVSLFGADDTATDGTPAVSGEGHLAGTLSDTPSHEHTPKQIQQSAGDFFYRHIAISYGDGAGGGN